MKFFFGSGRLCLDFTRTIRTRGAAATEGFNEPKDLERWISRALPELSSLPQRPAANLEPVRMLREAIYRSIQRARSGELPCVDDLSILNRHAAQPIAFPQLSGDRRKSYCASVALSTAALAQIARDAIELIGTDDIHRVRECADPGCTSLFLDTSRSDNRKWCSAMPCANRHKVQRYRARARIDKASAP